MKIDPSRLLLGGRWATASRHALCPQPPCGEPKQDLSSKFGLWVVSDPQAGSARGRGSPNGRQRRDAMLWHERTVPSAASTGRVIARRRAGWVRPERRLSAAARLEPSGDRQLDLARFEVVAVGIVRG